MKTAFAEWNNRIAPVFDVARRIRIVETRSRRVVGEVREELPEEAPAQKALHLAGLGINTLVCGAISGHLKAMVSSYGIRVVPFTAGELQEVIEAWLRGGLKKDVFAMPGCCGRGRRRSHVPGGSKQEKRAMKGRNRDIIEKTMGKEKGL